MAKTTSWIYLGIRNPLTATILLLQLLSLVSLVQCYPGGVSRGRLSPQLVRCTVVVTREGNLSSPSIISRQRKRRDTGISEGFAFKKEGRSAAECKAKGLVICGDTCAEQCCNAAKGLSCPANSSCISSGEIEYCCEKGKSCPEPVNCLDLHDSRCDINSGQLIKDPKDGKVNSCCIPAASRAQTSSDISGIVQTTHSVEARSEQTSANPSPESDRGGGDPAALIGGMIGGVIGIVIVGICVSYTATYYRQKLIEEKEAELHLWEDDDSSVTGASGEGSVLSSSSASSSSSGQSERSWDRRAENGLSSSMMSSWSKSTFPDTHPHLEKNTEIVVMKLENMSSSRGRSDSTNSGMGQMMSELDVPLATAAYRGVSKPFDWRSCQPLCQSSTNAVPQAQEGWKHYLPWLPLDLSLIPASSPILGPWADSRRSTVTFHQRRSQRISFMLDLPSMPPTPKLQGKRVPTRMSGALSSLNDDQIPQAFSIQKPPHALLSMI
ncbi:hypothetical protein BGX38DRAFT_569212 [Terfezia claveryi]|nr:hypothetical protein BGX38DRAFT_569212 [Terfezia claveryi]